MPLILTLNSILGFPRESPPRARPDCPRHALGRRSLIILASTEYSFVRFAHVAGRRHWQAAADRAAAVIEQPHRACTKIEFSFLNGNLAAPAGKRHMSACRAMSPCQLGDSTMKTLSVVTVAILLGLSGAAMAGSDSESQQSYTNATGPNPFMPEFSTPASSGSSAFGYSAQHHVVHRHVEK
jgi:hypothetical protein